MVADTTKSRQLKPLALINVVHFLPEPPIGHFYTSDGREIDSETTETALWTFFTEFYDFSGVVVEDRNLTLKEYYFGVIDSDEDISGNPDLHRCMSGFSLGLAALSSEDIGRLSFWKPR